MDEKEKLTIELTKSEAIVLFEFLSRFNLSDNQKTFEDQAEENVLFFLGDKLEKILVEPFMPNYTEILENARKELRDEE